MLIEHFSRNKAGASLFLLITLNLGNLILQTRLIANAANASTNLLDFFSKTFHNFGTGTINLIDSYGNYIQVKKENEALTKQIEEYQQIALQVNALEDENRKLRENLEYQQKSEFTTIPAEVISIDPDNWFQTIIINKGSEDGIMPYMPVIAYQVSKERVPIINEVDPGMNAEILDPLRKNEQFETREVLKQGVVGKIIQVASHSARILPITDQYSKLGIKIKKSNHWGILSGQSQSRELPVLEFITLAITLEEGDEIITSGASGMFPPNIPVGKITSQIKRLATFQEAIIQPEIDISRLTTVLVITKIPHNPEKDFTPSLSHETEQVAIQKIHGPVVEKKNMEENPPATTKEESAKPVKQKSGFKGLFQ